MLSSHRSKDETNIQIDKLALKRHNLTGWIDAEMGRPTSLLSRSSASCGYAEAGDYWVGHGCESQR